MNRISSGRFSGRHPFIVKDITELAYVANTTITQAPQEMPKKNKRQDILKAISKDGGIPALTKDVIEYINMVLWMSKKLSDPGYCRELWHEKEYTLGESYPELGSYHYNYYKYHGYKNQTLEFLRTTDGMQMDRIYMDYYETKGFPRRSFTSVFAAIVTACLMTDNVPEDTTLAKFIGLHDDFKENHITAAVVKCHSAYAKEFKLELSLRS